MQLFQEYLRKHARECVKHGVRISVIGRRDRLAPELLQAIQAAEKATSQGRTLDLRIAVDYSARDAIRRAALRWKGSHEPSREEFSGLLAEVSHCPRPEADVDLLIRTGGEQRLSDFLLWECAYAELCFIRRMWPDFQAADLQAALNDFRTRDRRFGRLPQAAAV
jgi:undecaprenyl diphosphate synthase